jgi:hypothetical protein
MHHFIAGAYFPYFYGFIVVHKVGMEKQIKSIKIGCIVYLAFCLGWEIAQTLIYTRDLQFNQLLFDFLGTALLYLCKRFLE